MATVSPWSILKDIFLSIFVPVSFLSSVFAFGYANETLRNSILPENFLIVIGFFGFSIIGILETISLNFSALVRLSISCLCIHPMFPTFPNTELIHPISMTILPGEFISRLTRITPTKSDSICPKFNMLFWAY